MFDALQFCNDFGVEWLSQGKNVGRGWIAVNDPFTYDTGFHGGFYLHDGHFYSWKTGGHSTFSVVKAITNKEDFEVYQILTEYGSRTQILKDLNKKVASASSIVLPGGELEKMHRRYLKKRRYDPDFLVEKYGLRGGSIVGDWAYRVIIPVFHNGVVVTYLGRDITGEQQLRYKNCPIELSVIDPKKILYNSDNCKGESVLVVEGSFDVMRFGDGSCCTLGTSVTEAQIRELSKFKKVFVMFDNEPKAQAKAKKICQMLSVMGVDVELVNHGWDHDLGDASDEEVEEVKKELCLCSI